jgi:hypothetical protein
MHRWIATGLSCLLCAATSRAVAGIPGIYYWEAERLAMVKALLSEGPSPSLARSAELAAGLPARGRGLDEDNADGADAQEMREAAEMLREEADDAVRREPRSVLEKDHDPPSGDKHDYVSYSPYWWPDPKKPDGLPFIRRDGKTNELWVAKGDRERLERLIDDVESLALAHYFLGKEKYGAHGRLLLRSWFIDQRTKMNPHLNYAQAIPGDKEGRGAGIIDARGFVTLLDAIELLKHTGALDESDEKALDEWFASYAKWLLTSDFGRKERRADNNHGTWYAAQAARVALYIGDEESARGLVEDGRNRLGEAVARDGSLPEELERTRSLHYSLLHLSAFASLARFGESLGVDLWNHEHDGRKPLEKALLYAAPGVIDQKKWPHEEIRDFRLNPPGVQLFRLAAARYGRPEFREVLAKAERSDRDRVYAPLVFEMVP